MFSPTGSWVAMVTPYSEDGRIDYGAVKVLIDRQIQYGTSELFFLGSAGEATLLSVAEKKELIHNVIQMTKGRIPVFFGCSAATTQEAADLARYCESEQADGVVFTVPPYVLISQEPVFEHMDTCMSAVSIPCGIYNNPARLGVTVRPETIKRLVDRHPNFVCDKEAVNSVQHLAEIRILCGDRLSLLCCDNPHYSLPIPTLALGGSGLANIGGNIIPEEVAAYSRPWTDMQIMQESREGFLKWYPLLTEFYRLSNPIVIKAALNILGLPGGHMRRPYMDYAGPHYEALKVMMQTMGVIDKYSVL